MGQPSYSAAELAERFGLELQGDGAVRVHGVGTLGRAQAGQLAFLANSKYRSQLAESQASVVAMRAEDAAGHGGTVLIARDPYAAFAKMAALFEPIPVRSAGIHPSADIAADASIDPGAHVGAFVSIGARSRIEAGAMIGPGCVIGDDCVVGAGSELVARVTLVTRVRLGQRVDAARIIRTQGNDPLERRAIAGDVVLFQRDCGCTHRRARLVDVCTRLRECLRLAGCQQRGQGEEEYAFHAGERCARRAQGPRGGAQAHSPGSERTCSPVGRFVIVGSGSHSRRGQCLSQQRAVPPGARFPTLSA